MPGLTCNACNKEFKDESEQKFHYKSEWHRYNLKRKAAGVPGVTEPLFLARQAALAMEKDKANQTPMLYSCSICRKGYKSDKALSQHFGSRNHMMKASRGTDQEEGKIVKQLPPRVVNKPTTHREVVRAGGEDSEEEWEEVGSEEELIGEATKSMTELNVDKSDDDNEMEESDENDDADDLFELDPACCFMCDLEHDSIVRCMIHMHKQHGFFIPDVEYLKDPTGLLTYLGLKVKRDFECLYCNYRCRPFGSLEAVRKHMTAKSHCKVHYGDGGDDDEAELEEFYDYSSSYVDEDGKQLVTLVDSGNNVELGTAGAELIIITQRSDGRVVTKTLGSREYMRYYRQKPHPSSTTDVAIIAALASRYRSMGLATVQTREKIVRLKVLKEMSKSGVETMRSKIGMKSNVIRNLPKNVTY